MKWGADKSTILGGGKEYSIRFWDVSNGEPKKILTGHTDGIKCVVQIDWVIDR
jgi:WD40 repeat protein